MFLQLFFRSWYIFHAGMQMEERSPSISKGLAVIVCTAMAFSYVAILYAPTFVLRLSPPTSLNVYMIRRFICAAIASIASLFACFLLIPIGSIRNTSSVLGIFGIRLDHMWQAVLFPLSLISLLYTGSLFCKSSCPANECEEEECYSESNSTEFAKIAFTRSLDKIYSLASSVLAWRNLVVAPLTEELVFRACMIPLLLCGGFKTYSIIFFSPIFFSLAHLNHFLELYYQQNYNFIKAALIVGLQLGYTVVFGWYASFLFIRTGHLVAPIVAHVFCNVMGLPIISPPRRKVATGIALAAGVASFVLLLFPATAPDLYNDRIDDCNCWHGYCSWK